MRTIAQCLAAYSQAFDNCAHSDNQEWREIWRGKITEIMDNAPAGSGIDHGTKLCFDGCCTSSSTRLSSTAWGTSLGKHSDRLFFHVDFHHLNEDGYYVGWTEHTVVVSPDWEGITIHISGRDRNQIKEYLHEVYSYWLNEPWPEKSLPQAKQVKQVKQAKEESDADADAR